MFLVDTNVISEMRKGLRANAGVIRFFRENGSGDLYLSVQTIGEIRRGIENLRGRGDTSQAARLGAWLDLLVMQYRERILEFDYECAQVLGASALTTRKSPHR